MFRTQEQLVDYITDKIWNWLQAVKPFELSNEALIDIVIGFVLGYSAALCMSGNL